MHGTRRLAVAVRRSLPFRHESRLRVFQTIHVKLNSQTMESATVPNDLAAYLAERPAGSVRLHLGCGGQKWRDFVNVDLYPYDSQPADRSREGCVADVFADMRSLGLSDASVDEIFTSHTLEHFVRWEAIDMLRDWHRMLKSGGSLIIETPSFWRCVLWLFHPRRTRRRVAMNQFYGNQLDRLDFETHRYVWTVRELQQVLAADVGFRHVEVSHDTWTHYPGRDMHVVATK